MIKRSETFLLNISNAKTDKEKFTIALRMIASLMDRINELEKNYNDHSSMLFAHGDPEQIMLDIEESERI